MRAGREGHAHEPADAGHGSRVQDLQEQGLDGEDRPKGAIASLVTGGAASIEYVVGSDVGVKFVLDLPQCLVDTNRHPWPPVLALS